MSLLVHCNVHAPISACNVHVPISALQRPCPFTTPYLCADTRSGIEHGGCVHCNVQRTRTTPYLCADTRSGRGHAALVHCKDPNTKKAPEITHFQVTRQKQCAQLRHQCLPPSNKQNLHNIKRLCHCCFCVWIVAV